MAVGVASSPQEETLSAVAAVGASTTVLLEASPLEDLLDGVASVVVLAQTVSLGAVQEALADTAVARPTTELDLFQAVAAAHSSSLRQQM